MTEAKARDQYKTKCEKIESSYSKMRQEKKKLEKEFDEQLKQWRATKQSHKNVVFELE